MVARLELAGVQEHHPAADGREGVLELEVVEDGALGDDVLEQGPQVGDVPLAVAQLVDEAALGLPGRDVERLVEGAVGGPDAQRGVEDQQGLSHRLHNVLGIFPGRLDDLLGLSPFGDVPKDEYHPDEIPSVIFDGRCAVVDASLAAVSGDQESLVPEPDG